MRVWYVAYGSNLSRERFERYLSGGTPAHGRSSNPGARDPSPPEEDRPATMPGTVWFASWSGRWGGAVAFYDDAAPAPGRSWTLARAYLLTGSQVLDVAAQEQGLPAGTFPGSPPSVAPGAAVALAEGRYGCLVGCAPIDGVPAVTITAPWHVGDEPVAAPSLAYLQTIASGLGECHGLGVAEQAAYLAALPGAAGVWDADSLARSLGS